ncbi:MAG: glycosyltransferase [Anaerolineae bacterium]|nr:MAG: glycosyltransferase [Anaerolineae bacterium]
MDILFIAHCPPYPPRVDERGLIYYLAREYERRRQLVDLVCFYDRPEQLADVPRYSHLFRDIKLVPSVQKTPGQLQQRLRKNTLHFPKNANEAWSPEMWEAIDFFLQTKPYLITYLFGALDVYEYHYLVQHYPTIFVPLAAHSHALPTRIAATKTRSEKKQLQQLLNVARSYESWMYTPFSRVVVNTENDARVLSSADPSLNVHVIPMGVDVDYFVPTGYPPAIPALLFIGDFANKDHCDAAVQICKYIYPQVRRNRPDLELYIVGDNPPPELKNFASEKVYITGHVLDVRPLFELSSIYVNPLVRQTGINKRILESLAMMTPVVATPKSCEGLSLQHEQHILLGESGEELVRGIQRLLQSPQLYQRLQHDGRDLINQHYTWQHVADQYQHLHSKLLGY